MAHVKPAYKITPPNATPKVVSKGSVSRPKPLPKWRPQAQPAPRRVSQPL
jgi:hypothetical protein